MKEKLLDAFLDFVKWALILTIAVWIFNYTHRYSLVSVGEGSAYKIDGITGESWYLFLEDEFFVKPKPKIVRKKIRTENFGIVYPWDTEEQPTKDFNYVQE